MVSGSVVQPGKGRVASTCSGGVHVKLHREEQVREELRWEKHVGDATVELEEELREEQESSTTKQDAD